MSNPMVKTWVLREEKHVSSLWQFLKLNAKAMSDRGTPLAVSIGPEKTKRSVLANAYYWGVVLKQISEQAWVNGRTYGPEVWHEHMRETFCPRVDKPFGGSCPSSTSIMTVEQFGIYTQQVEAYAASNLGVVFMAEDLPY